MNQLKEKYKINAVQEKKEEIDNEFFSDKEQKQKVHKKDKCLRNPDDEISNGDIVAALLGQNQSENLENNKEVRTKKDVSLYLDDLIKKTQNMEQLEMQLNKEKSYLNVNNIKSFDKSQRKSQESRSRKNQIVKQIDRINEKQNQIKTKVAQVLRNFNGKEGIQEFLKNNQQNEALMRIFNCIINLFGNMLDSFFEQCRTKGFDRKLTFFMNLFDFPQYLIEILKKFDVYIEQRRITSDQCSQTFQTLIEINENLSQDERMSLKQNHLYQFLTLCLEYLINHLEYQFKTMKPGNPEYECFQMEFQKLQFLQESHHLLQNPPQQHKNISQQKAQKSLMSKTFTKKQNHNNYKTYQMLSRNIPTRKLLNISQKLKEKGEDSPQKAEIKQLKEDIHLLRYYNDCLRSEIKAEKSFIKRKTPQWDKSQFKEHEFYSDRDKREKIIGRRLINNKPYFDELKEARNIIKQEEKKQIFDEFARYQEHSQWLIKFKNRQKNQQKQVYEQNLREIMDNRNVRKIIKAQEKSQIRDDYERQLIKSALNSDQYQQCLNQKDRLIEQINKNIFVFNLLRKEKSNHDETS